MNQESVRIGAGHQMEPVPFVFVAIADAKDSFLVCLPTPEAVDVLIERLRLGRVAAFGLDVPSRQPLGYRHFRTG